MLRTYRIEPRDFRLTRPFRISRGTKTVANSITVTVEQDGHVGRGEGIPYPRYNESVGASIIALEAVRSAIENGADRNAVQTLLPPGAARNALDCALWDLDARIAGTTVARMAGIGAETSVATAMTVGLDTPEAMARAAAELANVPLIKVKVDRSDPVAQIRAVRAAAPTPRVIVDPNESWTITEVRELQPLLHDLSIDLLEQPLPADDDDALEGFTPLVPIAADESVHEANDIDRLTGRYQIINIKLDKTGGLTGALELADAAERAGLGLMTGCMISSSLSIAPALIIARRCSFVDLDGPLWLADDYADGVREDAGVMHAPQPGFWGGEA